MLRYARNDSGGAGPLLLRLREVGRCAPREVSDCAYNVVFRLCL